jgi:hypothetical protein
MEVRYGCFFIEFLFHEEMFAMTLGQKKRAEKQSFSRPVLKELDRYDSFVFAAYRFWKRSTRPALSMSFCFPV